MIFYKSKIQNLLSLSIVYFSSTCLFLNLSINDAAYANNNIIKTTRNSTQKNICPSPELSLIRSFNTEKHYLYICSGDHKHPLGYYVRIPKSGGKFTAPLSKIEDKNYIAFKEGAAYVVNPYESLVSKPGRIILRERVKSATGAKGELVAKACNLGDKVFAQAETRSFIVYICGEDSPSRYVAIARNNSKRIELSLK
ncbi:MAG: hypothetical protein AAF208_14335, partial [Cyanobacteria bacterium P01_A01_bin.45]